MRAASDLLDVAPSSISRHIASLEEELGVDLIERGRHVVRLTPAGARVLEYYRDRASQREALLTELEELKGLRRGHVDLAVGEGLLRATLAPAIADFSQRFPQISLSIRSMPSRDVIPTIVNDECYFGVLMGPVGDPRLRVRSTFREPTCLICRPDHPLAGRSAVKMEELADQKLILPDAGFHVHQAMASVLEREGLRIPVLITCNSIQMILDSVLAGAGVTVLSLTSVREQTARGDLVAIPIDEPVLQEARVQIVKRAGRRLPSSAMILIETLEQFQRRFAQSTNRRD
ncbi:hypothetical protein N185_32440 [Sinorhizobium sp. GW3]|nr:hypothetical protein N185_32440 [Sinorhizobium sp. GW3]